MVIIYPEMVVRKIVRLRKIINAPISLLKNQFVLIVVSSAVLVI